MMRFHCHLVVLDYGCIASDFFALHCFSLNPLVKRQSRTLSSRISYQLRVPSCCKRNCCRKFRERAELVEKQNEWKTMLDNKSAIERPAWIFNLLKRMQVHQARLKSKYTFQTHPFVSNVLVQSRLLVNPNQSESGYPCRMDLSGSTDMVLG